MAAAEQPSSAADGLNGPSRLPAAWVARLTSIGITQEEYLSRDQKQRMDICCLLADIPGAKSKTSEENKEITSDDATPAANSAKPPAELKNVGLQASPEVGEAAIQTDISHPSPAPTPRLPTLAAPSRADDRESASAAAAAAAPMDTDMGDRRKEREREVVRKKDKDSSVMDEDKSAAASDRKRPSSAVGESDSGKGSEDKRSKKRKKGRDRSQGAAAAGAAEGSPALSSRDEPEVATPRANNKLLRVWKRKPEEVMKGVGDDDLRNIAELMIQEKTAEDSAEFQNWNISWSWADKDKKKVGLFKAGPGPPYEDFYTEPKKSLTYNKLQEVLTKALKARNAKRRMAQKGDAPALPSPVEPLSPARLDALARALLLHVKRKTTRRALGLPWAASLCITWLTQQHHYKVQISYSMLRTAQRTLTFSDGQEKEWCDKKVETFAPKANNYEALWEACRLAIGKRNDFSRDLGLKAYINPAIIDDVKDGNCSIAPFPADTHTGHE
ncbi:unnamed protein product [Vitrella brassicaformis CCMP3155]|uniref:Uncharacterized protein n=1 Tax=Vitrella brassicaformis (strain CCMP3155) TaxID=1169540 RepID=A0A0G4GWP2_VITBC|nr:unnamed protein product [Vitrella brassicaformis CCMP3155]|eukprot:CEM35377.1 unnamed protein product [Vitrella brassicaformis CCMP3155]